jgi:hypothetical protein
VNENSNQANAYRAYINPTIAANNNYLYADPDNPNDQPIVVMPVGGFYNRKENSLTSYTVRNNLAYIRSFGLHDINFLIGQEIRSADRQNSDNTGYGYQYGYGGTPLVDYKIIKQSVEQGKQYYSMANTYDRFSSYYATAGYTYNQRYNLSGTVRYDGSNQLGAESTARWLPTWSASGAWNVDKENFMQNIKGISYLKLRGSYGLAGNTANAKNSSVVLKTKNTQRQYSSDIESYTYIDDLANSELTFEKQYSGNVGADIGFVNSRLNITTDVYWKNGFDLLGNINTSGIGGQQIKDGNYDTLYSHGVELTVGGDIIKQRNWGWKSTFIFSYNVDKITDDKDNPEIFTQLKPAGANKVGYPVSSLFSINYKGLDHYTGVPNFVNEDGEISNHINIQNTNTQYLKYEGPVDAPYTGGFNNTFNYGPFSLNTQINYQAGNK